MNEPTTRSAPASPNDSRSPTGGLARRAPGAALAILAVVVLVVLSPMVGALPLFGAPSHGADRPAPAYAPHRALAASAGGTAGAVPFGSTLPLRAGLLPSPSGAVRSVLAGTPAPTVVGAAAPQSTPSNWFISNYSTETSITSVGSNSTLVASTNDQWGILNGTTTLAGWIALPFSGFFWTHGFTAAARSTDSGKDWSLSWPGVNSSWTQSGNAAYGSIHFGGGVLASNANGSDVLLADTWGQPCYMFGFGTVSSSSLCNSTANFTAPLGVSVARSTDGGVTWSHVAVIASYSPYRYVVVNLPGCPTASGFLNANFTSATPSLALNPKNGHAVVSTTYVSYSYAGALFCSGGTVYINSSKVVIDVYTISSYSTDGGFSWSTPQIRSNSQSAYPIQTIGPAPTYKNVMIFQDYINSTSTGVPFAFTSSTTNGTSWSVAADLPIYQLPPNGIAGGTDGFPVNNVPYSMVWDTNASSAHYGTLYLAYGDNRSTTTGDPSIAFTRSFNGGSSWSAPIYVTPNTPNSVQYAIAALAVEPGGRLWLTFYGVNTASGEYYEYGSTSSDGGSTWSAPFVVSDAISLAIPNTYYPFGGLQGAAGTSAGDYATWADCRSANCVSGGNQYVYVANLHAVSVSATISGINATVVTLGKSSTLALNGTAVWENGATVSVQVPNWVPAPGDPNDVYAFVNFTGLTSSLNDPTVFTYAGTGSLMANYALVPAAWITGYVGPVASGLQVSVNAATVPLVAYNATQKQFNLTVESGPAYPVTVSAGSYYVPYTTTVTTSPHAASHIDVVLSKTHGWIAGTVTPASGSVTVDGSPVTVNSTSGVFNVTAIWGNHSVVGSLAGFTPFSTNVSVTPYRTTGVNVIMSGSHIQGTVSPVNAIVQVDGSPVPVSSGSFLTGEIPGGVHRVTATAPGYSFYGWNVSVTPGATASVQITLTNQGWINGTITPITGSVQVNGKYQKVYADGSFNVTVAANKPYEVIGLLSGYNNSYANITVTPGNVTYVALSLNKTVVKQPHCGDPGQPACTPPSNNSPQNTNWLLYAGLGAVIVVVAALAVVLLMRRGRGGSSASTGSAEPESGSAEGGSSSGSYGDEGAAGNAPPPPPGAN